MVAAESDDAGLEDEVGALDVDGSGTDTRKLEPSESLAQLLPNTFRETMESAAALDQLAHLCTSVPAVMLPRTDLEHACVLIEQSMVAPADGFVNDRN